MKSHYLFCLSFFFFSFIGYAQIVNIPDVNFKNVLLSSGVDQNNDGQIQVSEALLYTNMNFNPLENPHPPISDMTGIEAFTNLTDLYIDYNNLTTINLSTLTQLERLSVQSNQLTALDLTGLTALKYLNCGLNDIEVLDVSALTNLEELICWINPIASLDLIQLNALTFLNCQYNELTELNVVNNTNLKSLWCNYNLLTSLDVNNLVNLEDFECSNNLITVLDVHALANVTNFNCNTNQITSLDVTGMNSLTGLTCAENGMTSLNLSAVDNLTNLSCAGNQLTALDISNLLNLRSLQAYSNLLTSLDFTNTTKLKSINLSENLFTTLDFSPIQPYPVSYTPYQYDLRNNPNLTYVNVKNGTRIGTMSGGQTHWNTFNASGCDNLAYICADDSNIPFITAPPSTAVSSYCTFTPGGNHNTITGLFTLDIDNNGCDANDYLLQNAKILIEDSLTTGATFTNASGNYLFYTPAGNFTISPEFENPYFTVSPQSATISFADNNSNIGTQDFCVTPNGIHNDLEITIIPGMPSRPGFDTTFQLVFKNKGNQVLSGTVNFTFDDEILDFVSSDPAAGNQSLNTLQWSYDNLLPFESRTINFILNVNSPQEFPPVNIGDTLNFTASIDPVAGDETIRDNTFALTQIVVGSYDPNDKTCLEGETIAPEVVGDFLHYLIRFENTGNAIAENIVVKDMIDTEKFDVSSLQLVGSSHPQTTRISGRKVEFIFNGINLPAAQDDEAESHGYVAFKIKTKSTLVPGDAVANSADIFFDYNFPIATNTAVTTIAILANNTFEDKSVSIFPNPVKDELHITAKANITSIQLYDDYGKLTETKFANATESVFNIEKNANGVYFVKILTETGVKVEKVIKE